MTASDTRAVELALDSAFNWDPARERAAVEDAVLDRYSAGWGRPGDFGVVAELEQALVGAAYCRLMRGYGYVDDATPEVTIGVDPTCRGRGIGGRLLFELAALARAEGFARLSLSVEPHNPARRLYVRAGYRAVGRDPGGSVLMLREL